MSYSVVNDLAKAMKALDGKKKYKMRGVISARFKNTLLFMVD